MHELVNYQVLITIMQGIFYKSDLSNIIVYSSRNKLNKHIKHWKLQRKRRQNLSTNYYIHSQINSALLPYLRSQWVASFFNFMNELNSSS